MPEPGSQLNAALEEAEQVRSDLGRQLHDTLCQSLTGLNMMVRVLARRAQLGVPVPVASLEELGVTVDGIMDEVRALLRQLQPVLSEERGLMEGLAQLSLETNSKMRCLFHCDEPVLVSDPKVALSLYRIAEEAVRSAVRHSAATQVSLTLSRENGQITLEIRDNGRRSADETGEAQEIRLMETRAAAIGADFAVAAPPECKTTVKCKSQQNLAILSNKTQKPTLRQRTGDAPDSASQHPR